MSVSSTVPHRAALCVNKNYRETLNCRSFQLVEKLESCVKQELFSFEILLPTLVFNRPGVAGAVLQTPSLLINSLIHSVILFLQTFTTS